MTTTKTAKAMTSTKSLLTSAKKINSLLINFRSSLWNFSLSLGQTKILRLKKNREKNGRHLGKEKERGQKEIKEKIKGKFWVDLAWTFFLSSRTFVLRRDRLLLMRPCSSVRFICSSVSLPECWSVGPTHHFLEN